MPAHAGPIGTATPLVVGRVDPQGRWVFFCQVRRDTNGDGKIWGGASNHGLVGDAFEPYLWRDGEEITIDELLDASADGRWIATRERDKSWLLDMQTGARTELAVATAADPYSFAPRVEIDPNSQRMLFVRTIADGGEVVVRELASGSETVLHASAGQLWRAWLDDDGEHVWADVVLADTNGDGALAVPRADTNLVVGACSSSTATSTWGEWYGDAPVRFAGLEGDALTELAGGVAFFDGGVLAHADDGALVLRRTAETTNVAPASCRATVVHLDRARRRLFFVCSSDAVEVRTPTGGESYSIDRWAPLQRWDGAGAEPVGIEVDAPAQDRLDHIVTKTRDGALFDFTTGAPWVEGHDRVLATHGDRGLVIRHDGVPCLIERGTAERTCFAGDERIDPTFLETDMRVAGKIVMTPIGDRRAALLDLEAARVLGFLDDRDRVYGIDVHGRLLVGEHDQRGVVPGPLRWDHGVVTNKPRGRSR